MTSFTACENDCCVRGGSVKNTSVYLLVQQFHLHFSKARTYNYLLRLYVWFPIQFHRVGSKGASRPQEKIRIDYCLGSRSSRPFHQHKTKYQTAGGTQL